MLCLPLRVSIALLFFESEFGARLTPLFTTFCHQLGSHVCPEPHLSGTGGQALPAGQHCTISSIPQVPLRVEGQFLSKCSGSRGSSFQEVRGALRRTQGCRGASGTQPLPWGPLLDPYPCLGSSDDLDTQLQSSGVSQRGSDLAASPHLCPHQWVVSPAPLSFPTPTCPTPVLSSPAHPRHNDQPQGDPSAALHWRTCHWSTACPTQAFALINGTPLSH